MQRRQVACVATTLKEKNEWIKRIQIAVKLHKDALKAIKRAGNELVEADPILFEKMLLKQTSKVYYPLSSRLPIQVVKKDSRALGGKTHSESMFQKDDEMGLDSEKWKVLLGPAGEMDLDADASFIVEDQLHDIADEHEADEMFAPSSSLFMSTGFFENPRTKLPPKPKSGESVEEDEDTEHLLQETSSMFLQSGMFDMKDIPSKRETKPHLTSQAEDDGYEDDDGLLQATSSMFLDSAVFDMKTSEKEEPVSKKRIAALGLPPLTPGASPAVTSKSRGAALGPVPIPKSPKSRAAALGPVPRPLEQSSRDAGLGSPPVHLESKIKTVPSASKQPTSRAAELGPLPATPELKKKAAALGPVPIPSAADMTAKPTASGPVSSGTDFVSRADPRPSPGRTAAIGGLGPIPSSAKRIIPPTIIPPVSSSYILSSSSQASKSPSAMDFAMMKSEATASAPHVPVTSSSSGSSPSPTFVQAETPAPAAASPYIPVTSWSSSSVLPASKMKAEVITPIPASPYVSATSSSTAPSSSIVTSSSALSSSYNYDFEVYDPALGIQVLCRCSSAQEALFFLLPQLFNLAQPLWIPR